MSQEIRILVHDNITDNEQEADSAIVAIRENNKQQLELQESSRQCQGDHRQQEPNKPEEIRVLVHRCENNNKSRQCQRDHRYELQEWKCYHSHHRNRKRT
jgi:pyruvate-formate lyase-activating enzyme